MLPQAEYQAGQIGIGGEAIGRPSRGREVCVVLKLGSVDDHKRVCSVLNLSGRGHRNSDT